MAAICLQGYSRGEQDTPIFSDTLLTALCRLDATFKFVKHPGRGGKNSCLSVARDGFPVKPSSTDNEEDRTVSSVFGDHVEHRGTNNHYMTEQDITALKMTFLVILRRIDDVDSVSTFFSLHRAIETYRTHRVTTAVSLSPTPHTPRQTASARQSRARSLLRESVRRWCLYTLHLLTISHCTLVETVAPASKASWTTKRYTTSIQPHHKRVVNARVGYSKIQVTKMVYKANNNEDADNDTGFVLLPDEIDIYYNPTRVAHGVTKVTHKVRIYYNLSH